MLSGNNETDSFLYKFDVPSERFKLVQKFRTNGATYARYVEVPSQRGPEQFLMIANAATAKDGKSGESYVLVYKYTDGIFVAYQQIVFESAIRQIVPNLVGIVCFFDLYGDDGENRKRGDMFMERGLLR